MAVLMLWNAAVPARALAASLCTDASAEPDQAPNAPATAITAASRLMMVRWCVMGLLLAFALALYAKLRFGGPEGHRATCLDWRHACPICQASPGLRPSRTAAAPASPRVLTSSLRRIAETWCDTVFCDRIKRCAMSALRSPSATSARISISRG